MNLYPVNSQGTLQYVTLYIREDLLSQGPLDILGRCFDEPNSKAKVIMIRIIITFLAVIFQGCIFNTKQNSELVQFESLLGGEENKKLLDGYLFQMESKITKTYKAHTLWENYNMFLDDILSNGTQSLITYDSTDCQLIYNFESSKLANQYHFQKFDTVYFDGGVVTIDKNGEEEIEIVYNDSSEITKRVKHLTEQGYAELKEFGKLPFALQNGELKNNEVKKYYLNRDRSCLPMFEDYIRTLYLQKPDYGNYIVKSNLLYEIYLPNIVYNAQCDER